MRMPEIKEVCAAGSKKDRVWVVFPENKRICFWNIRNEENKYKLIFRDNGNDIREIDRYNQFTYSDTHVVAINFLEIYMYYRRKDDIEKLRKCYPEIYGFIEDLVVDIRI